MYNRDLQLTNCSGENMAAAGEPKAQGLGYSLLQQRLTYAEQPRGPTYLGRLGDANREARETLAQLRSRDRGQQEDHTRPIPVKPEAKYFNGPDLRRQNSTFATAAAPSLEPEGTRGRTLAQTKNQSPVSAPRTTATEDKEEEAKTEAIQQLREKYNNMMRQSLERKADRVLSEMKQNGNANR